MVEMNWGNQREFFRLQEMSGPNNKIIFRLHSTSHSGGGNRETLASKSPNKFKLEKPRKIEVSPIGEVIYVSKQNC